MTVDAVFREPCITSRVVTRLIVKSVALTINFNRELRRAAVKSRM